jgi:hypothetical protein
MRSGSARGRRLLIAAIRPANFLRYDVTPRAARKPAGCHVVGTTWIDLGEASEGQQSEPSGDFWLDVPRTPASPRGKVGCVSGRACASLSAANSEQRTGSLSRVGRRKTLEDGWGVVTARTCSPAAKRGAIICGLCLLETSPC